MLHFFLLLAEFCRADAEQCLEGGCEGTGALEADSVGKFGYGIFLLREHFRGFLEPQVADEVP